MSRQSEAVQLFEFEFQKVVDNLLHNGTASQILSDSH